MTTDTNYDDRHGDLRALAADAMRGALEALLDEPSTSDLRDLVPPDFTDRLIEVAWQHQFDLDKVRFRREMRLYLSTASSLAADAGTPK